MGHRLFDNIFTVAISLEHESVSLSDVLTFYCTNLHGVLYSNIHQCTKYNLYNIKLFIYHIMRHVCMVLLFLRLFSLQAKRMCSHNSYFQPRHMRGPEISLLCQKHNYIYFFFSQIPLPNHHACGNIMSSAPASKIFYSASIKMEMSKCRQL